MPQFKIVVMLVWLSNVDGSIVGQASGIAVDLPSCQRVAIQKIAAESANPDLVGSTPKFSCWNTNAELSPQARNSAPGSVHL